MKNLFSCRRAFAGLTILLLVWGGNVLRVQANPTGGSVSQGTATFSTSGSQFTINQTSANTLINWQSFDIGLGESVVFNQPSSTSLAWNYIHDSNPSQILGSLSANGYVILQNPNGFYVGGSAAITAHGLIMTTASIPALNFSSGGPWSFNTPPPTAKIVNYGQINITGGGPAFLIASDIENHGTVSAPGGKIGLYAGQTVLVSTAPDGRGLSAQVTLPAGSVDNEGKLVADAGSIAARARFVNQNGVVQANSARNVNGTIELVASDSMKLGAHSVVSARGDVQGTSDGGSVTIRSGNSFSDQNGSVINIAGGTQGGNGGQVDISAPQLGLIQSRINGQAAPGFIGGTLTFDPTDVTIDSAYVNSLNSQIISGGLSLVNIEADHNIELTTYWTLPSPGSSATLNLTAGNNIILDNGTGIGTSFGGSYDWTLNLTAGTQLTSKSQLTAGNDGIYLQGDAFIYTLSGDINLWAANEVIVNGGDIGGITTFHGGNINVTAQYGDVNTGNNAHGYDFGLAAAPYYAVDEYLGGISTAAGGNVTINAGNNVISYLPTQSDLNNPQYNNDGTLIYDGGTGAFGSEPGNVTITAGGSVYGHYVVANGAGTITAGGDVGVSPTDLNQSHGFALSLIKGSWNVSAPNGSIYVQDIRNPNGVFGEHQNSAFANYAGYHIFDYDSSSSVLLDAGNSVEFTGKNAPHAPPSVKHNGVVQALVPFILPPSLTVIAGGDFVLDTSVILYPSPDQNLNLTIGGNFTGAPQPADSANLNLEMSDSASSQWNPTALSPSFGISDHAATPPELDNPNPVLISVGGDMKDVDLYTTKQTQISVSGDVVNSGFVGENLHAGDITSITVGGSIINSPEYSFESLPSAIISANPFQPGVWDSVFALAINPNSVSAVTSFDAKNDIGSDSLAKYLNLHNYLLFPRSITSDFYGRNPGFVYDPNSKELGFKGSLSSRLTAAQINALESGTITVLVADAQGNPILDANNHLQTVTYTFNWGPAVAQLATDSVGNTTTAGLGFQIGGPGQFNINVAGSMNLGNSSGIVSYGFASKGYSGFRDYSSLEGVCGTLNSGGAAINVDVAGDINMISSRITSVDGGDIKVNAGGEMNLSQGSFVFPVDDCYGIFTTGHSDVSVTANGDINVGSGHIATFNGGNVFVKSLNGDVNCGSGQNIALAVYVIYIDPKTGDITTDLLGDLNNAASLKLDPAPFGSGILAEYPTEKYQTPGSRGEPGDITILTPHGNIVAGQGGILQFALNGSIAGGPTITLQAGDPDHITYAVNSDGETGMYVNGVFHRESNILLGIGGVIGGTINASAAHIEGLFISKGNANINAVQSFKGTVLATGSANFTGGGNISGTVIGIGGINTGGSGINNANLLSQNISGGNGGSYSSLATSASTSAASQSAAQQASQATQQVASNNNEEDKKKKKKKSEGLVRSVGRVTVILPNAS